MNSYVGTYGPFPPPPLVKPQLRLSLFGAPQVSYCGQPLSLARRQTRGLLYRLGAQLEPVSRDELSLLFWPESDDYTARRNLTRLLNLVRDNLPEPQALVATTLSVYLDRNHVWSDADTLMRLDRQNSVSACRQTEELYSGGFLAGFSLHNNAEFDVWKTTTLTYMQGCCLESLRKLIDYHSARGEYPLAVQYARRYLEIDNLAETVHRELIGLYARLGERGEAQGQFEDCVLVLERELGVEPLPETRAVYDEALRPASRPISPALPPVSFRFDLPLLGRDLEWNQLAAAYKRMQHSGFLFVSGESGVGKSRLMHAFVSEQNALVLTGRCYSGTQGLDFHPVVEALRPALNSSLLVEGNINPIWLAEAASLLPELHASLDHHAFPSGADAAPSKGQTARLKLFESLFQVLAALAKKIDVILYFDDLEWADEATILWLQYLTTRLHESRVCVCVTYCTEAGDVLSRLKQNLQRNELMAELVLNNLPVATVAEMVDHLKQSTQGIQEGDDGAVAARLHAMTGGNAFFVLELLRALVTGGCPQVKPEQMPIPQTVQAAIFRRVDRVSATARQVLEAAAVLDPHLDFTLLLLTSGRSEVEVDAGLRELVQHQLLCDSPRGLHFQHALVQQAILARLPIWRRSLLQRREHEAWQLMATTDDAL